MSMPSARPHDSGALVTLLAGLVASAFGCGVGVVEVGTPSARSADPDNASPTEDTPPAGDTPPGDDDPLPGDDEPLPGDDDPPADPPDLVLASSWSTQLGSSEAALSDGGTWDNLYCTPAQWAEVLEVVPGDEAEWTLTPNVMEVTNAGSQNCAMVENTTSIPAGGVDFFVRMYIRVVDENQTGFHSFKLDVLNPQVAFWAVHEAVAGVSYRAQLGFYNWTGPDWRMFWPRDPLPQGEWFRFEFHVEFIDVAQRHYRVWPRVYDMDGVLLYDADSYVNTDSPRTLAEAYATGSYATFTSLDHARFIALGYEGNVMATPQGRRWYYAGFAASTEGWVGPIEP